MGIFLHCHNHTLFQHNNGVWMQNNEMGKGTFQCKFYNKEFNIKHYKNGGFNGNIETLWIITYLHMLTAIM